MHNDASAQASFLRSAWAKCEVAERQSQVRQHVNGKDVMICMVLPANQQFPLILYIACALDTISGSNDNFIVKRPISFYLCLGRFEAKLFERCAPFWSSSNDLCESICSLKRGIAVVQFKSFLFQLFVNGSHIGHDELDQRVEVLHCNQPVSQWWRPGCLVQRLLKPSSQLTIRSCNGNSGLRRRERWHKLWARPRSCFLLSNFVSLMTIAVENSMSQSWGHTQYLKYPLQCMGKTQNHCQWKHAALAVLWVIVTCSVKVAYQAMHLTIFPSSPLRDSTGQPLDSKTDVRASQPWQPKATHQDSSCKGMQFSFLR